MTHHAHTFKSSLAQWNIRRLKKALLESPVDLEVSELATATGMSERNARQYIVHLKSLNQIHVGSWRRRDRWQPIKRYRLGPGRDSPRPKPFTHAEVCARHRKANPDKVVDDIMVKRGRRTKPRRDPLTTALFGNPMTTFYKPHVTMIQATKTTTRPSLEAGPNVHLYLGKYSEGRGKPQVWDLYRNPRTNEVFAIHEKD